MTKLNLEQVDAEVVKFLTNLLEKKGMGILPENIVADMLMDLFTRFQSALLISVMNEMDEETLTKFNELMGEGADVDESFKFFKESVPNMEKIIAKTMEEFSKTYLGE